MQLANRSSIALLSGLFLRSSSHICLPNQTPLYGTMPRAPVISICHGGGPMPVMGDPGHKNLIKSMSEKVPSILHLGTPEAPRAIVLITAHWSERKPTISSAKKHKLYYDYGGFPPETYKLKYDAPGSPDVAKEVYGLLERGGFSPEMDEERANIPIVQLSVMSSDSPAQHYAMGQALSPLRDSGVAILGSGSATFHNLRIMFSGGTNDGGFKTRNAKWSETVTNVVQTEDAEERGKKFDNWREWIGAKEAHPVGGVEHFLPLIVCAGAGGEGKAEAFADDLMGLKQYSYYWT